MKKKGLFFAILLLLLPIMMKGFTACGNKANTYTVAFDTNGGRPTNTVTVEQGCSINFPSAIKHGFTFNGWFDNAEFDGNILSSPYTPNCNVTLYAKYSANPLEYKQIGEGYQISSIKDKTVTEIIIPELYDNKKVIGIANAAFLGCSSLTSVIIPDSVTSIGK